METESISNDSGLLSEFSQQIGQLLRVYRLTRISTLSTQKKEEAKIGAYCRLQLIINVAIDEKISAINTHHNVQYNKLSHGKRKKKQNRNNV